MLTRSFWFYPSFIFLGLAAASARRPWNAGTLALVAILVVTVVVSYTRSEFIVAAGIILVILALRLLKERRPGKFFRRLATIGVVLAAAVIVMAVALPTQTNYFLSRMASVTHASTVVGDEDLMSRQRDVQTVTSTLWESGDVLVGTPFGVVNAVSRQADTAVADSTWVGLLYWTGLAGVVLVAAMFVSFGIRALRLFFRSTDTSPEFLGAVFVAVIAATVISSFFSWTFLHSFNYPMGFWLFAFIAGEASKRRASDSSVPPSEILESADDANG